MAPRRRPPAPLAVVLAGCCSLAVLQPLAAGPAPAAPAGSRAADPPGRPELFDSPPDESPAARPGGAGPEAADPEAAEVRGQVRVQKSGEPLAGATVTLRPEGAAPDSGGRSAATDRQGEFHFAQVGPGSWILRVEHVGYRPRTDTLAVGEGDDVVLRIPMAVSPVDLEPLVVRVRRGWLVERGFYRRRSKDLGYFLTPEDLERRSVHRLTQLLKIVPGVRLVRDCSSLPCENFIRMSATASSSCRVQYYMDGNELVPPVNPDDHMVLDLAAVEVYRGIAETPAQYYGRCGSVVMWSKRR